MDLVKKKNSNEYWSVIYMFLKMIISVKNYFVSSFWDFSEQKSSENIKILRKIDYGGVELKMSQIELTKNFFLKDIIVAIYEKSSRVHLGFFYKWY